LSDLNRNPKIEARLKILHVILIVKYDVTSILKTAKNFLFYL